MNRILRYSLATLLLLPAVALAAPKELKPGLDIAAVVGPDAVSSFDVDARLKFLIVTSGLPNTPDVQKRMRPQVIYTLIDERLQFQEASASKFQVSDQEIRQAIVGLEKERGMPEGAIDRLMRDNHIPQETFQNQIRTQLMWRNYVLKRIRPSIRVNDEEVAIARKNFKATPAAQELQIAVLTLPVEKAAREAEVRQIVQNLARDLRGGASFEEVSRQLTGSKGSKADAFWVRPQQLDPSLARVLAGAQAGTISEPVRIQAGYAIVKVYDTRSLEKEEVKDTELKIKEILLKIKDDASQKDADVLLSIGEEVAKNPGSCAEEGVGGIDNLKDFDIEVKLRSDRALALPVGIRGIVDGLKPGEISKPYASAEGIRLYMLCERKDLSDEKVNDDRIRNHLYQQKMELEVQKRMRDLRRDTFIEIR